MQKSGALSMTLTNTNPAAGHDGVGQMNTSWQNSTARDSQTPYRSQVSDRAAATCELLLSALRCARLRVLLLANEIDAVGVAVAGEMVPLDTAFDWLDEIGAWEFLSPEFGREIVS
jgi:hypothetical protein